MQKLVLAPLATLLVAVASAHGEEPQAGRYQMVAVPASQSQTFPQTLLLDTATGQTWILHHETGQAIQWLPLWNGPASDSLAAVVGRRWRIALTDGPIPIARAARPASAAAAQPPTPLSAGRRISSKATRGAEKINLGALCNVLRQFHFHVVASPTIRTGPGLPPERVIPSLSSSGFQFLGSLMIRRILMLPFGSQRSLPVVKGNGFFRAHFSAA